MLFLLLFRPRGVVSNVFHALKNLFLILLKIFLKNVGGTRSQMGGEIFQIFQMGESPPSPPPTRENPDYHKQKILLKLKISKN